MSSNNEPILGVPTNIITGFLGVGKTSAILSLLKNKPKNERWAVLVNEFGEIGVDGSLVQGQQSEQQVFIREVPGGRMCCLAGLPMQIALNQLLQKAKPDRLLIEPTGLGHPKEVLQVLSTEHYRKVLRLQKNITLVDARKLSDTRYTDHETFNQQIMIADTVVGNKRDLYQAGDEESLKTYVKKVAHANTKVIFAEFGVISSLELDGDTHFNEYPPHHHHHSHSKPLASQAPLPESGMLKAINNGEDFHSVGWRFAPEKVFDRQKLIVLLLELKVERMKAVIITDTGIFGYNLTSDGLSEVELDECAESRIELISEVVDETFEEQLLSCLK
ncbi:CobW family GTP-binding protein [Psychromonas sp. KJ10-10]|uniref:CobW family GTP-binding protein n=1 Tax=Psychromonas sp. KJ10-10 TaxID=3391823 RepID=UPI0039B626A2